MTKIIILFIDPQNGLKSLLNFVLNPKLLFTDMSNVFALVKSKDTNEKIHSQNLPPQLKPI